MNNQTNNQHSITPCPWLELLKLQHARRIELMGRNIELEFQRLIMQSLVRPITTNYNSVFQKVYSEVRIACPQLITDSTLDVIMNDIFTSDVLLLMGSQIRQHLWTDNITK